MKKTIAILLALTMMISLCACGEQAEEDAAERVVESTPQPMAEVREADAAVKSTIRMNSLWTSSAERYATLTGAQVSESSVEDATLLILDVDTLMSMADSCADLGQSAAYACLSEQSYALLSDDGRVIGLPLELASVAVGVNTELLEQAGYSMDRLDGFKALRRFSTSVTDRTEDLGFSAWAPMALAEGSGQKLTQYLFNLPVYAELQESGSFTGKYVGDYSDSYYKDLFTVMLDYGAKTGNACNSVSDADALDAFAQGECLFCLLGSWELQELEDKGFDMSALAFVPAWMDFEDESEWGFITDTTLYVAIRQGDVAEEHAAEDFLYWALTDSESREELSSLYEGMPYEGFSSGNAMLSQNAENDAAGLTAIPWLHRQIQDLESWDTYFLTQLHQITPDNVVWRWQVMVWELTDRWNGQE